MTFLRPSLSKKMFPVSRVGKNTASWDFFFFFTNFNFCKLECTGGGGGGGKKVVLKIREKKSSSRPFLAHSGGGQETTFCLRVAQFHLSP